MDVLNHRHCCVRLNVERERVHGFASTDVGTLRFTHYAQFIICLYWIDSVSCIKCIRIDRRLILKWMNGWLHWLIGMPNALNRAGLGWHLFHQNNSLRLTTGISVDIRCQRHCHQPMWTEFIFQLEASIQRGICTFGMRATSTISWMP